jgi:predicted DCC family thiol-disulfide oxidoreductase YuxK
MKRLYVLFDGDCPLCEAVVRRLREQPMFVDVQFMSSDAPRAAEMFPQIVTSVPQTEVVAIADTGEVYRGDAAWLMTLWALREYRAWSVVLAKPGYRGLVRWAVASVGRHRMSLSKLLRLSEKRALEARGAGRSEPLNACPSNACTDAWFGVKGEQAR